MQVKEARDAELNKGINIKLRNCCLLPPFVFAYELLLLEYSNNNTNPNIHTEGTSPRSLAEVRVIKIKQGRQKGNKMSLILR